MLKDAYLKAKEIIETHQEEMHAIAEFLLEKETITGKEFMEIYRSFHKEETMSEDSSEEHPAEVLQETADVISDNVTGDAGDEEE